MHVGILWLLWSSKLAHFILNNSTRNPTNHPVVRLSPPQCLDPSFNLLLLGCT